MQERFGDQEEARTGQALRNVGEKILMWFVFALILWPNTGQPGLKLWNVSDLCLKLQGP